MHKLLIWLAIIAFSSVLAKSVLATGEKSEIRFDIPSQSTGNNVRRASSESTKSFSSSGYGFEYIFSNKIGLGYRSESIQTEIESQGSVTKKQSLQATALELSYRHASTKGRLLGTHIKYVCPVAGKWVVSGTGIATGGTADCFT